MNATELFLADGRNAGIYFCAECRNVARTEPEANQCCAPYKCTVCGTDVDRKTYRTVCPPCEKAKREAAEKARFAAAEKVTSWDGYIMAEGYGYSDGYFPSVDDLRDYVEDEELEMPEYVWTCDRSNFAHLSIESITERIADGGEAYEDFDVDDLFGLEELEKAIEVFNAANDSVVSWNPNQKRALLVNKSNVQAMASADTQTPPKQ